MAHADLELAPGDLVLIDLGPVRGTEQDGQRPALVISSSEMHAFTRWAVVCPITRNVHPWPTKVFLPDGLAAAGAVLADQVRSIDRRERVVRKLGEVPNPITSAVRAKVAALLGIDCEVREA